MTRFSSNTVLTPNVDIGDVNLLNVAGEKVNPATSQDFGDSAAGAFVRQDVNFTIARETGGNLALILSALAPSNVAGPTKVTVTSTSSSLSDLSLTLNASTVRLHIITPTSGIFWNYGTATTASAPLLTGTNTIFGSLASLNTLEFITSSGTVDIWVEELA